MLGSPPNGPLIPFDYQPLTRVVFGPGVLAQVGDLTRELGMRRVLIVTDHGLRHAGHLERTAAFLRQADVQVAVYDQVHPNPTTADVEDCLLAAREARIDGLIGLGGGSSMDCAKGVNFLLTNGGKMEDYWGVGKATKPMLPMIAIPTTSGTGSEAQSFALIAKADSHMKMACGDKKAACKVAILDPELTVSLPPGVTSATGIDAISHAVETFVTLKRNPVSQLFSLQAWQLLIRAFPVVLENPHSLEARGAMLLGAHLAGAAIENSMLGATHAAVNPLSAHFDLTHGVAIGVMLPHVVRYNTPVAGPLYAQLAATAGVCDSHDSRAPDLLAHHLQQLFHTAGSPTRLSDCEFNHDLIPTLAREAELQWTGKFNPRPVAASDFEELYRCAF